MQWIFVLGIRENVSTEDSFELSMLEALRSLGKIKHLGEKSHRDSGVCPLLVVDI